MKLNEATKMRPYDANRLRKALGATTSQLDGSAYWIIDAARVRGYDRPSAEQAVRSAGFDPAQEMMTKIFGR